MRQGVKGARDTDRFDVIVVGGGHAGCEAALAAARMGARTLLLNLSLENAALMACNPAVGGPAKGHLVREVDALGGEQARATDASTLHIRWLNTSKGPAVQTLRAQCDFRLFGQWYRRVLERTPNLQVFQEMAVGLLVEGGRVAGVRTRIGAFEASRVVLATGTYQGGKVFIGLTGFESGPLGQVAASGLAESLQELGFTTGRLKTGTPARIAAESVNWERLLPQESAEEPLAFRFGNEGAVYRGYACYLTRTTEETHRIIREYLPESPLYSGMIEGVGPRYCPSIEDRVVRFPDRESHQVFLEPAAADSNEIYLQNFSTSLPLRAQELMIRSLPGCEKARLVRPAYAIEYDWMPPTQLHPWLETKGLRGLFCAGQINGTSGYEEAAAQGILAGINAVLSLRGEEPFVPGRDEAYAGVLVDDLVTRGTSEPYRMLTSRCEHRLRLRHDNADLRLSAYGRRFGLIDDQRWAGFVKEWKTLEEERERLRKTRISASPALDEALAALGSARVEGSITGEELLRRPEIGYDAVARICPPSEPLSENVVHRLEIEVKYAPYVERQEIQVERMRRMERVRIPEGFDPASIQGLSSEGRQKMGANRPDTLGQASRISGVTPADVQLLWVALEAWRREGNGKNK